MEILDFDDVEFGQIYEGQLNYYVFLPKNEHNYFSIFYDSEKTAGMVVSRNQWNEIAHNDPYGQHEYSFVYRYCQPLYNKNAAKHIIDFIFEKDKVWK